MDKKDLEGVIGRAKDKIKEFTGGDKAERERKLEEMKNRVREEAGNLKERAGNLRQEIKDRLGKKDTES
jgi:hypothetical protein